MLFARVQLMKFIIHIDFSAIQRTLLNSIRLNSDVKYLINYKPQALLVFHATGAFVGESLKTGMKYLNMNAQW
jgi:hypothetical protein